MQTVIEAKAGVVLPTGEAGIQMFERVDCDRGHELAKFPNESRDVIVISTGFDPTNKHVERPSCVCQLTANSVCLLQESTRILRFGGLLFVYGIPQELGLWGERLSGMRDETQQMVFKYWIALEL